MARLSVYRAENKIRNTVVQYSCYGVYFVRSIAKY